MPRLRFSDGRLVYGVVRTRVHPDSTTYHLDDPAGVPNVGCRGSMDAAPDCARCRGCKRAITSPFRDYGPFCSSGCLARADR